MATPLTLNVGPQFNMTSFVNQLSSLYQNKGFIVSATNFGTSTAIKFDKNTGGINMLMGLGQGVTANCTLSNGMLNINYTNEDWTGKIIGICVGWFLCLIPFITSIIGLFRQFQLTKDISNDATMLAGGAAGSVGTYAAQAPMGQQTYIAPQPSVAPQASAAPNAQVAPVSPVPVAPVDAAPIAATEEVVVAWNCQCGAQGNTGAFCGQCGSPRP